MPLNFNYKDYKCLNKAIPQIDRPCTVAYYLSFNELYGKIWVGFSSQKSEMLLYRVFI